MRKTYKAVVIGLVSLILLSLAASTFAWLGQNNNSAEHKIDKGTVIRQYFHCGTGSEDDPFVITRPIHYYHLVELYQRTNGFAAQDYHFQLGYDLDGSGEKKVYAYDEFGNTDGSATDTLNMAYYSEEFALLPVGTSDVPFNGTFDGSGLTIENLHVKAVETVGDRTFGTADVGIFGYLGPDATLKDTYFNGVTIDLTGSDETRPCTNETVHDADGDGTADTVFVGYIAGHIRMSTQVTNVYLNDMSIIGGHDAISTFGYFGCVEDNDGQMTSTLGSLVATLRSKGDNAGFGGSIDMERIFNRLLAVSNLADDNGVGKYLKSRAFIYDEATGSTHMIEGSEVYANATYSYTGTTVNFYYYSTPAGGSFNISSANRATSAAGTNNIYECLYGASKQLPLTETTYTIHAEQQTLNTFTIFDGSRYLNTNLSAVSAGTSGTTQWQIDAQGHIYTQPTVTLEGTEYLNDQKYYLNRAGDGSLTVSTTPQTVWSKSDNAIACTVGGITYPLRYNGNTWVAANAKVITDGNGHYLRITGTGTTAYTDTTDPSLATEFTFSNTNTNGGYISAVYNGTTVYLRNQSNALRLTTSTTNRTNWSNDGQNIYNGTYFLGYDNGWKLNSAANTRRYKIHSGDTYLSLSGGTLTTTDAENATVWTFSNVATNPSGTISAKNGTQTLYLHGTRSGSRNNYTYTLDANTASTTWSNSNGKLTGSNVGVRFQNGQFVGDATGNATALSYDVVSALPSLVTDAPAKALTFTEASTTRRTVSESAVQSKSGADTYFPIRVDVDDNGNFPSDFAASPNNTGYIVSGANIYDSQDSGSNSDFQKSAGDIRVAGWPISNISSSYSTNSHSLTTVYTVDANNNHAMTDAQKASDVYKEAAKQLEETLNGQSRVFGLHFMDAAISMDNIITVPQATIMQQTFENYELPEDSIDFNVIERGNICFFAGNYFTNNNAFFSLHVIERDENQHITAIREISEIYEHKTDDRANYIYKYKDGTYTNADGTYTGATRLDGDYKTTPVFETDWITAPTGMSTGSRLYYFEIPCNPGEFALGSVKGKTGAYLVYLDIASNGGDAIKAVVDEDQQNPLKAFKVEYRTAPDTIPEGENSIMICSADVPEGATTENFSFDISFDKTDTAKEYPKGTYTINVTNQTGEDVSVYVYLCDNDNNAFTPFEYAYRLVYTNEDGIPTTVPHYTVDYWQSIAGFVIPSSGEAREMTMEEYTEYAKSE